MGTNKLADKLLSLKSRSNHIAITPQSPPTAQGVGKNKLADKLLSLLGAEREYVQLHRDTTCACDWHAIAV